MNITAIYNPRKPNGDLGDMKCSVCGCNGAAYVKIQDVEPKINVCKSCLVEWDRLINDVIMDDIMRSVRRREKSNA